VIAFLARSPKNKLKPVELTKKPITEVDFFKSLIDNLFSVCGLTCHLESFPPLRGLRFASGLRSAPCASSLARSDAAIAIACFADVTTGPFTEPLCKRPLVNFFITSLDGITLLLRASFRLVGSA
jgi:hypothetical protein